MGAMLEIDWEAIKTLCLTLGVRPAIRSLGLEDTSTAEAIRKRAHREGWLASIPRDQPVPITVSKPVPNVPKSPSEALADIYREDRVVTRVDLSAASRKAARELATKTGSDLISDGGTTLKTVAQAASIVHGWQEQTQSRVVLNIGALSEGISVEAIEQVAEPEHDVDMDPLSY